MTMCERRRSVLVQASSSCFYPGQSMPGNTCIVCGSTRTKDPHASFHHFPSDQARRQVQCMAKCIAVHQCWSAQILSRLFEAFPGSWCKQRSWHQCGQAVCLIPRQISHHFSFGTWIVQKVHSGLLQGCLWQWAQPLVCHLPSLKLAATIRQNKHRSSSFGLLCTWPSF